MNVVQADVALAPIASAIGDPARARMLLVLMDGRARTSTELAVLADIGPPTASVHLQRLKALGLVKVLAQGKHRYYSLDRPEVADALEALSRLAGRTHPSHVPTTPHALRAARTCYDHLAGALGVAIYDRLCALEWLTPPRADTSCDVTSRGSTGFTDMLGIDVGTARALRRRFAFACVDWSERRPHLGGALGAAILRRAIQQRWIVRDLDSRIVRLTAAGRRQLGSRLGVELEKEISSARPA